MSWDDWFDSDLMLYWFKEKSGKLPRWAKILLTPITPVIVLLYWASYYILGSIFLFIVIPLAIATWVIFTVTLKPLGYLWEKEIARR